MFDIQLKHLFRYHLILLLILILFIALSRVIGIKMMNSEKYKNYMSAETEEIFNEMVESTEGMTLEECAEYIERRQEQSFMKQDNKAELDAIMRYQTELQYCFDVRGWRNYCRYGKGIVSLNMPADLRSNSQKYSGFEVPQVVNSDPFSRYIYLSTFSAAPLLIMLLVGAMSADGHEKGIFKQVDISAELKAYYKSKELLMVILVLFICITDQLSLMIISGILERPEYSKAAFQSILGFGSSAFRARISQVIVWTSAKEIISGLLCYNIFTMLARHLCSMKKYIIACSAIISVMSAAAIYIPEFAPYMFAGITDTNNVLYRLGYINRMDASEAPVVIIGMASVLAGLWQWRYQSLKEIMER